MDLLVTDPLVPLKVYFLSLHLRPLAKTQLVHNDLLKNYKSIFILISTRLSLSVYLYRRNTSPATDQRSRPGHIIDDRSKFFRRFALVFFYIEGYQEEYRLSFLYAPLIIDLFNPPRSVVVIDGNKRLCFVFLEPSMFQKAVQFPHSVSTLDSDSLKLLSEQALIQIVWSYKSLSYSDPRLMKLPH